MEKKIFYRVSNIKTNQGLWYDIDGNFTGLIHEKFKFCACSGLPMPFDKEVIGYLSCVDNLKEMWTWFPKEDIKKLEEYGYFLHEYESEDYKEYENHWIFNQYTAKLIRKIEICLYETNNSREDKMKNSDVVVPKKVPEELKEEIKQRILNSTKKHAKIKKKQQEQIKKRKDFKQIVHEGSKFFFEQKEAKNIISDSFKITNFSIAYAIMKVNDPAPKDFIICKCAFAIKAPTDKWKDHVAHGLCGYRLANPSIWTVTIPVPAMLWYFEHNFIKGALENIISSRVILLAPEIPQRVRNNLYKNLQQRYRRLND